MLLQFNFGNFRSFKEEVSLDMTAGDVHEYQERVSTIGKEKILKVAAIYGANASGKSNVYKAFEFMHDYVLYSSIVMDDEDEGNLSRLIQNVISSYKAYFDNEEDSIFEVYFIDNNTARTYNYGFCFNKKNVTEEWLNVKAKTSTKFNNVFYRDIEGIESSNQIAREIRFIKDKIKPNKLLLSYARLLDITHVSTVFNWFKTMDLVDFADLDYVSFKSNHLPTPFIENQQYRAKLIQFIHSFDDSIVDFHIEENLSEESDNKSYKVESVHNVDGKLVRIPLEEESAGTLKMFMLFIDLYSTIKNGDVLVVDELNARLHPLLVRSLLLLFLNPELNTNHAQLIFTTHDTWQLQNKLLRRDEIWLVEKNNNVSSLYSLSDVVDSKGNKIRNDENLEKNYLVGKYGAIPKLSTFKWFEE